MVGVVRRRVWSVVRRRVWSVVRGGLRIAAMKTRVTEESLRGVGEERSER